MKTRDKQAPRLLKAMAPTVSIILPTYNRLNYLPAAITSVLEQTFRDWEFLIADDGSDASTKDYLRTLAVDPRVKLIWLSHSGRPGVVRNLALREAGGEYVAFLDSDDIWLPRKLEMQIASLRSDPRRRWSHTKYVLVDELLNPTAWARRTGGWSTPNGWILEKLVRSQTVIALPSVVTRRDLLEEVGGFDEQLISCEDVDLWLRLATRSEIDAIDEPLTLVRRHGNHFSGDSVRGFQDSRTVAEKMLRMDGIEHLHAVLHKQRAVIAAGLARSHAAVGNRASALRAILESAQYSWQYRQWWLGVFASIARACAPEAVWNFARNCRNSWRESK